MTYYLMHENNKLALFEYVNYTISVVSINDKLVNKLPLLELSTKNLKDKITEWILQRGIPVTKQGIKTDLSKLQEKDTLTYMISNLGLSLTDHYWFCPQEKEKGKDSNYIWEEINPYQNNFKAVYSLNLSDDKKSIAAKPNYTPSTTLKGNLKKKWVIDEHSTRRLIKGNTCRQSLCEVLATEIHKRQGRFEYTPYSLIEITSDGQPIIGCECPNFTSINTEFIPAIDIINSVKKSNQRNYYETYIEYCGTHGIDINYIREFMEYQILTDFLITNTDRHLNNFGVLRDSKTLQLIKPAPIFDSGNSMFYNTSNIKVDYGLLNIGVTSFKKFEVELLAYVTNPMLVDINKLPTLEEVYSLFEKDPAANDSETLNKLVRAYQRKIEFLNELQCGVKIYTYDYLRKHRVKLDKVRNERN